MKISRATRRSVSPFGVRSEEKDLFDLLLDEIDSKCPDLSPQTQDPDKMDLFQDIGLLPAALRKIAAAPANDAPQLGALCDYLIKHQIQLNASGLFDPCFNAMKILFDRKTEIFMVDHHDKDHCEKMGWAEDYRDVVLFAEERNVLVGRFFDPVTRDHPGHFSGFIQAWSETGNVDRLCHFVDFCAKISRLSFEYFLLGSHPALARVIRNKDVMRDILERCGPLIKKLKSPTWEADILKSLS